MRGYGRQVDPLEGEMIVTTEITRTGIGPQVAPFAAVALLTAAATATHAAAELTGEQATVTAGVAATAIVLAVLVATKKGQRIACRKSRTRLYAFLTVAAGWLTTVTAIGMSWNAFALLSVMVGAVSLHWWRDKRIVNPGPETVAEVVDIDVYAKLWAEHVGGKGGALEGSRLVRPEAIASGIRYDLLLVPGKQDHSQVIGVLRKLRGALHIKRGQDLLIEEHPTLDEPHCRLTVVTASPVKHGVSWPGPSAFNAETGKVDLGPFVDGLGVACWTVYTDSRLMGGYLQGGTNAGKSGMIDSIAMSVAASESHPTVIFYADGQGGTSSAILPQYADHVALTAEQCTAMLEGLIQLIEHRQEENDLDRVTTFTPRPDRPGVLLIIDECHKYLKYEDIQFMMGTIAREGGKVGVNAILASQDPLLSAFGGSGLGNHAETIRSNLLMGNGVILRSKSKNTKQVFEVEVNPSQFPPTPGYSMLVEQGEEARAVALRGYHVTKELAAHWPSRINWRSLDTGSANAYGSGYLDRHAIAAAEREAKRARVEARRAGLPVPGEAITRTIQALGSMSSAFHVAQFPVWRAPAAPARSELTDSQRAVRDAIAAGARKPGEIRDAVGLSESRVHDLLGELMAADVIDKPRYGQYVVKAA